MKRSDHIGAAVSYLRICIGVEATVSAVLFLKSDFTCTVVLIHLIVTACADVLTERMVFKFFK